MRKYLARTMHYFQIAGFCCLLVILMAVYVDFLQSTIGFYLIIMFVCISVATPLSLIILDQHFVLWIIDFVSQHSYRVSTCTPQDQMTVKLGTFRPNYLSITLCL